MLRICHSNREISYSEALTEYFPVNFTFFSSSALPTHLHYNYPSAPHYSIKMLHLSFLYLIMLRIFIFSSHILISDYHFSYHSQVISLLSELIFFC